VGCRRRHDRQAAARPERLARIEPLQGSTTSTRRGDPLGTLVERLAAAEIGATFNQYAHSTALCARLERYLATHDEARVLLVGEAAGYRGARVSGIPFTSERQLTGRGPAEATATIVHRTLHELGADEDVLLWNVVPTHPGTPTENRTPTRAEVEAGLAFARELARGRRVLAVGRVAQRALDAPYVRHPSHGGARAFRETLRACLS
jgi:uracil-DNA glycosylase